MQDHYQYLKVFWRSQEYIPEIILDTINGYRLPAIVLRRQCITNAVCGTDHIDQLMARTRHASNKNYAHAQAVRSVLGTLTRSP